MRKILPLILILTLLASCALADPIALLDDLAEDISEPYDPEDPSSGTFVYSCRYPHVDEEAEGSMGINTFYADQLEYELGFTMPMIREAFEGYDSSTVITYTVTCNNDDYFSVLITKEENNPDVIRTTWTGNVFSRKEGNTGNTFSLPKLLGILDPAENEEWKQDFQTEKADTLIREMVWDLIEENENGFDYNGLTEEALSHIFFPEEDFYLDENGDPVFYIQPGDVYYDDVPEGVGLITFPLALEDILDEL